MLYARCTPFNTVFTIQYVARIDRNNVSRLAFLVESQQQQQNENKQFIQKNKYRINISKGSACEFYMQSHFECERFVQRT